MEAKARIAGIVIRDGKLLMLQGRGYLELWTPGGKKDDNETDEECLRRQIKEEIGCNLVEAKFFKEYKTYNYYHSKRAVVERVYIGKIDGEIKPNPEIEKVVWFTKDDFTDKKYPMSAHTDKNLIPDLIAEGLW